MSKKTKRVVVGGTFDILHAGHKALLDRAFGLGKVTVGLTSDIFAKRMKKRKVKKFSERKNNLEKFCFKNFSEKPKIKKIENKFGFSIKEGFNYIVVSPETYKNAVLINKEREKKNRRPIKVVKIKFVLDKTGKPISSSNLSKNTY